MDKRWTLLMDWWIRWGVSYCGRVKRIFRFFTKFVFFFIFSFDFFFIFFKWWISTLVCTICGRPSACVCVYICKQVFRKTMFVQIHLWLFIVFAAFFRLHMFFFCFIFELFDLMCLINEVSCSQLKLSKFVWMLSNSLDVINFVKYLIAHTTANILRHNSAGNCI